MIKANEALEISDSNPAFNKFMEDVEREIKMAANQGRVVTYVLVGPGHTLDRAVALLIEEGYEIQNTVSGFRISWGKT